MPIFEVTLTVQSTGLIEAESESDAINKARNFRYIKKRLMDERGDDTITASCDITGDYEADYLLLDGVHTLEEVSR
jgi:hypothetical protein